MERQSYLPKPVAKHPFLKPRPAKFCKSLLEQLKAALNAGLVSKDNTNFHLLQNSTKKPHISASKGAGAFKSFALFWSLFPVWEFLHVYNMKFSENESN